MFNEITIKQISSKLYVVMRSFTKSIIFGVLIFILMIANSLQINAQAKNDPPADTSKVIEEVKEYSKKDSFFSKIVKSILKEEDETKSGKTARDPDRKLIKQYTGKIIRQIDVSVVDVFGGSVYNPLDSERTWIEDAGNSVHMDTKGWLIKNMLIFSEGDVFIPYYIQESERIIRLSPYIYDVRIIPQKISNNSDSIDIMVFVQNIWTINGGASLNMSKKSGAVSFSDLNFLGFGNEFDVGLKVDKKFINGWDWDGSYLVNNIGNTFISSDLYYESDQNNQEYGLKVSRDFISPVINWGGGVGQLWHNKRFIDSIFTGKFARYSSQDYWLGYAFNVFPGDKTENKQNNFNIAGRVTQTSYSLKPKHDTTKLFQDNIFFLARIGYSDVEYHQDQYIFGLGKTEDVPLVKTGELLVGYKKGQTSDSPYLGLKFGYSFLMNDESYLYNKLQIGSFLKNNQWQNLSTFLETMYFSRLYVSGRWKWRHYIGGRLSYNYDPARLLDVLNINNENGIRGFSDAELVGNKKLLVNYEANFFVPIKVLGFKFAVITFADLGLIALNNSYLLTSKLYQGYGFGLRIKNEHLIFPNMQFMFGYYPNSQSSGADKFNLYYQSAMFNRFNPYPFSIPSVVIVE